MSNQDQKDKLAPALKRRKKRKDPFFVKRMLTIIGVAVVAITVGLVFYFESVRQSNAANEDRITDDLAETEVKLDTLEDVLNYGSTEDMIAFIKKDNQLNPSQPTPILYEKLKKHIALCQELENRSEELSEEQILEIKNALLVLSYVAFERIGPNKQLGAEMEEEAIETTQRLSNDEDQEIAKTALSTLIAIRIIKAYRSENETEDLLKAQDSIKQFFSRYPDDKRIELFIALILESTKNQDDCDISTKFHTSFKTLFADSDNESIQNDIHALEGKLLLFRHQLVDKNGHPNIKFRKDIDSLPDRFDNFLAEDYTMSPPVAQFLVNTLLGLELKKRSVEANYVREKFLDRLGDEEKYDGVRQAMLDAEVRINLKDQVVSFPDHTKTEYMVVQYVGNNEECLIALNSLRKMQEIGPDRRLECVLITDRSPIDKIQKFFDLSGWTDFKFIQDPNRESAYFRAYPAKWYPSALVLDESGKVIEINPTLDYMEQLVEKLKRGY